MAHLLYYQTEKIAFKDAFEKKMNCSEARIVFDKLCRHYKLGKPYLNWTSGHRCPKAFGSYRVLLNVDYNTFGVLCHELAHIKEVQKYLHSGHSKRHWKIMKGMIGYCKKKNWFEDELNRRTAPKPIKAQPTEAELKLKEIERLNKNCKRYETKVKMYSNKLKKAQQKIARIEKRIALKG